MALYVVAMPPDEFEAWRAQQRRPAASRRRRRRARTTLFDSRGCGACHAVRGTRRDGRAGPDLTHVGGRLSLGAGTLRNDAGALARWIATSQHVKPGNLMPAFGMLPARRARRASPPTSRACGERFRAIVR